MNIIEPTALERSISKISSYGKKFHIDKRRCCLALRQLFNLMLLVALLKLNSRYLLAFPNAGTAAICTRKESIMNIGFDKSIGTPK